MDLHFLEDETLTSNLDDSQASRLLHILERSAQIDKDHIDQVILLVKLLNQVCLNNQEQILFEDITSKLEAKYAQTAH